MVIIALGFAFCTLLIMFFVQGQRNASLRAFDQNTQSLVSLGTRLQAIDAELNALDLALSPKLNVSSQSLSPQSLALKLGLEWQLNTIDAANVPALAPFRKEGQVSQDFLTAALLQSFRQNQEAANQQSRKLSRKPVGEAERKRFLQKQEELERQRQEALKRLKDAQIQKAVLLPSAQERARAIEREAPSEEFIAPQSNSLDETTDLDTVKTLPPGSSLQTAQDDLSSADFGLRPEELAMNANGFFLDRFPTELQSIKQPAQGKRFTTNDKVLVIRSRPNATVVAPFDGVVEYAGDFRSFGPTLIIRHAVDEGRESHHSVLYGLTFLTVESGLPVAKGEPVGQMGRADTVTGNRQAQEVRLYYELQVNGRKIDPLLWLE